MTLTSSQIEEIFRSCLSGLAMVNVSGFVGAVTAVSPPAIDSGAYLRPALAADSGRGMGLHG